FSPGSWRKRGRGRSCHSGGPSPSIGATRVAPDRPVGLPRDWSRFGGRIILPLEGDPQPERYPVSDSTTPVILSAVRTPIGRYLGGLSGFSAPQLGAMVIREAVARSGVDAGAIDEVIMGQ